MSKLQQAEHQGEDQEHDGHPLGPAGQAGVGGLGFVLGQEGVGGAANGAGQAGALAGLEHDHGDEGQGHDEVNDGQDDLGSSHETHILSVDSSVSRAHGPAQVSGMISHF